MIDLFGFTWIVGRHWGLAHPDDICYADAGPIDIKNDHEVWLGIEHNPKVFYFDDWPKVYPWAVGYLVSNEAIKYGYLKVDFEFPLGKQVWPAIWLSDCETWPPEIDIMEAWSDQYQWCIFKPKTPEKVYRYTPFSNRIFPSVHLGTKPSEHWFKSFQRMGGSPKKWMKVGERNTCELIWTPDRVVVLYNGHKAMDVKDKKIMKYYNDSKGMFIHIDNYVSNDFTMDDFNLLSEPGYTKWFKIFGLQYDPEYQKYI